MYVEKINNEDLIPAIDTEYLTSKGFTFEIIPENGTILLIIKDFPLSSAYIPHIADLLIILPAGYPNTALDMFWTFPDVKLKNGNWPLKAEEHGKYNDIVWQRWSRHGTWRSGVDTLQNYITTVRKEIDKGK